MKNVPVVLLDEVTSALDGESEDKIVRRIENLKEKDVSAVIAYVMILHFFYSLILSMSVRFTPETFNNALIVKYSFFSLAHVSVAFSFFANNIYS